MYERRLKFKLVLSYSGYASDVTAYVTSHEVKRVTPSEWQKD